MNADQDRIPALLEQVRPPACRLGARRATISRTFCVRVSGPSQAQKDALLLDRQSAINGMYAGEQSVVPQFVQGAKEA